VPTPIFERDGHRFVATAAARGPWDPGSCHGGAPAALLAAAIDAAPALVPMQGVRLTYDILRPVPTGRRLDLDVEVAREGKRVQVLSATLVDASEGTELVRCRALRIRSGEMALPDERPRPGGPPTPGPEDLERFGGLDGFEADGFWRAVDVRFVAGMLGEPGRGVAWFRMVAPLAEGLDITPLARAAAAGDFGNGIGAPVPMGPFRYLNPDLTIDLHRLPIGEWVALTADSVAHPTGIGLATSVLADQQGVIGSALQSLYVEAAP
jgi:acyl-coenzyme A thioesterase PaaI-like protein